MTDLLKKIDIAEYQYGTLGAILIKEGLLKENEVMTPEQEFYEELLGFMTKFPLETSYNCDFLKELLLNDELTWQEKGNKLLNIFKCWFYDEREDYYYWVL